MTDSHNPYHRVWEMLPHPEQSRAKVEVTSQVKLEGTKEFEAPREVVWSVINDPSKMAKTMPGVESFEITDDTPLEAKVKVPLGLGGLKMSIDFEKLEERPLEFASLNAKGKGVGALMNMTTSFTLSGEGEHDLDGVGGRREDRRPGRLDGAARPAADHQPAGRERPHRARGEGAGREGECRGRVASRSEGRCCHAPHRLPRVRIVLGSRDMSRTGSRRRLVAVPFRIGVMQLTMEPLDEMLASARAMDEAGMDTVWLAEAYPWWRKHQMEARGSTVVSALMARETTRLTIGWGIISPYTRHPVQVAMDARVVQEAAGPGRFIVGFGTSKIFLNNTSGGPPKVTKPLAHMRDSVEIVRGILGGERFEYDGKVFERRRPRALGRAPTRRAGTCPSTSPATAPMMQQLGGEIGDGLPDAVDHDARVRPLHRGNIVGRRTSARPDDVDLGCTIVASIHATDRDRGRDGAREIAGMYLANKVQNIQGSADVLLELAGIEQDEIRPVAEAMEQGGRLAAKAEVTDALLDKCKPIAGTPADCIAAIEEYRDAGLHAHHARALGRGPPRADPPVRRAGAPALPRLMATTAVTVDRDRLVETASRMIGTHSFTGDEQGMARADGRALRGPRAARPVAAGRGRPRQRARHAGRAPAAARA